MVRMDSIRLAKSLQLKFGVKEGDIIGLCSENRLEYPVIIFAALYLGATVAPLNVTYTKRTAHFTFTLRNFDFFFLYSFFDVFSGEFHHAINLSRPRIIFTSNAVTESTIAVSKQNKFVESIIEIDRTGTDSGTVNGVNVTKMVDLMNSISISDCSTFACKPIDLANNVALVLCSSGTTGLPKGVELTQRNIMVGTSQLK